MGRRLALLIATHEHEDPTLRRLTSPAADVESLAAVLRDPRIAGFEVTVLVNEPHHRVGAAIAELYRDRLRDDVTLLYFTGHGLKDDDGRLYLATSNTRRDSLLFTSLPAEQLDYAMVGCASRQKVLVLDCCYSGAFPAGRGVKADTEVHALEKFHGRGRTVLTASDSTQYSFEGDRVHGSATQSVFTRHLVEGLRDGTADLDGDGDIIVDELYSYVHDRVVEEMPQQRPKKQSDVEGRIVIARNVAWTLPGYVRNALGSPIATDRLGALEALQHLHRIGNPTVRAQVVAEIERLAEDDSRTVSAAAETRLRAIRPAAQLDDTPAAEPEAAGPAAQSADVGPADGTDLVVVLNPRSGDVITTVALPGQKFGLAVSPDSARVYVANADLNTVSVIDAGSAAVIDTIETGGFTMDLAISPDGRRGYVAQESAIGVFPTGSTALTATIPVPDAGVLEAIAVTPDGGRVFAVTRNDGRLIEIDATTETVTGSTTFEAGAVTGDVAVTDDRAYISLRSSDSLAVLDISGG